MHRCSSPLVLTDELDPDLHEDADELDADLHDDAEKYDADLHNDADHHDYGDHPSTGQHDHDDQTTAARDISLMIVIAVINYFSSREQLAKAASFRFKFELKKFTTKN